MAIATLESLCRQYPGWRVDLSHMQMRRSDRGVVPGSREALMENIAHQITYSMGIQEKWLRVAPLGKCVDKLVKWEIGQPGSEYTLTEEYETVGKDGQKGKHIRLYGQPQGDYVPMLIVADKIAAESLQAREADKTFETLPDEVSADTKLLRSVLQRSRLFAADQELLWMSKRARFQLVGVLENVQVGTIPAMRLLVYKDLVHNSGHTILAWGQDGPLGKDVSGKPLWGLVMTNSPHHRPDGKWHQITPNN